MESDDKNTSKTVHENTKENTLFLLGLFVGDKKRENWKKISLVFLIGAAIGTLIGIIVAISQSFAIGFNFAWKVYGIWWILSPFIGGAIILGIWIVFLLLGVFWYLTDLLISKIRGKETYDSVGDLLNALTFFVLVGLLFFIPINIGFNKAKENHNLVDKNETLNIDSLKNIIIDNKESLLNIVETSEIMLNEINKTKNSLNEIEKNTFNIKSDIINNLIYLDSTYTELKRMEQKKEDIDYIKEELIKNISSDSIITKSDIEKGNYRNMFYGFVIGIISSLIASYIFNFLKRKN